MRSKAAHLCGPTLEFANRTGNEMETCDAIVIGSGQGGTPLSIALAEAGRKTVLVESQHVGGTCVNEGCTPTKTMVASARVAYLARRAQDYGVCGCKVSMDESRVRERKRAIVTSFRSGNEARIHNTQGLELIMGAAKFIGHKTIAVQESGGIRHFTAENIFISTGTRAKHPPIDGLSTVPFLDNISIMELDSVPEHLMILGGGYIGVEFGQMFRRFGSKVTIVHPHSRLLMREDRDVVEELATILGQDGIDLRFESRALRVGNHAGAIEIEIATKRGTERLTASHLLLAAGRRPNTDALNLEAAGVELDEHGFVRTNDRLETTVPGIYVLGDVKGGPAFTHIAYDDYRVLRSNLLQGGNRSILERLVPYTVFTDPQLGRVGLTEAEAEAKGLDFAVAKMPMTNVARALEMDETRGFMKVVIDNYNEQILGAAVLSVEGGELMSMLEIAMMGRVPYSALRDGVFAHPTLAESLNNLFRDPVRSQPQLKEKQPAGAA